MKIHSVPTRTTLAPRKIPVMGVCYPVRFGRGRSVFEPFILPVIVAMIAALIFYLNEGSNLAN